MEEKSIHHLTEAFDGISHILCAMDNIYPGVPEVQNVYHCLIENINSLKKQTVGGGKGLEIG